MNACPFGHGGGKTRKRTSAFEKSVFQLKRHAATPCSCIFLWYGFCNHMIAQRHPGELPESLPSLPLPLPPFVFSSSSTRSCGLTVMWTTFGVASLKRDSSELFSKRGEHTGRHSLTYPSRYSYRPAASQSESDGWNQATSVSPPILPFS